MYFICSTNIIDTFSRVYPGVFTYDANRAILFGETELVPERELRHCIELALTYNLRKIGSS